MKTGAKVFLWVLGILLALAVVFVGLYFGLPQFHDWVVNLFTPDKAEEGKTATEAMAELFMRI